MLSFQYNSKHPHLIPPIQHFSARRRRLRRLKPLKEKFTSIKGDLQKSQKILNKISKGAQLYLYELHELREEKEATHAATAARHAWYGMS